MIDSRPTESRPADTAPPSGAIDQLHERFRMQAALNQRIGMNTGSMSDEEKAR